MARAKAQREAAQAKNTDNLTPDQQREVAAIEARRTTAGTPDAEKTE